MNKSRLTYSVLVMAAILAFTVGSKDATAMPIEGTIGSGGSVTPIDSSGNATADYSVAAGTTGLDFGMAVVVLASDSYSGVFPFPTLPTYNAFQFDAFSSPVVLWTATSGLNTATFTMTAVSVTTQNDKNLFLSGSGILSLTGFDDTPGVWNFSGDTAGGTFSFSNGNTATSASVPEPGTLSLLGFGLIGLVVRKKIMKERKVLVV